MSYRLGQSGLRQKLLGGCSAFGLLKPRTVAPVVFGAAMACGIGLDARPAVAAAVLCSPDASGSAIASASESCAGAGDTIDYATVPATMSSTVTLNSVTISGNLATGVSINNNGFDISLLDAGTNTIDTTANSTPSNGIFMTGGGGNVSVSLGNTTISASFNGIGLQSSGTGQINVQTANITISAVHAGVIAVNSGTGLVQVLNTDTNITAGTYAINAQSGGDVTIDSYGNSTLSGTTNGIYAASAGGAINVGHLLTPIAGNISGATNAGIETVNATGATTIYNSASMAGLSSASFGIVAASTTGSISVQNSGQIGSPGAGNGTNAFGIYAASSGNNTTGIQVSNSGNIFVDAGNATAGIVASNFGVGAVTVTNSGTIDPPTSGIVAVGNGPVVVNNFGVVNATRYGIYGNSSGTGPVSVFENLSTITANGTTTYYNPVVIASAGTGISAITNQGDVLVSGLGRDLTGNGYGNVSADDGLAGPVIATGGDGIVAATGAGNVTVRLAGYVAGNGTATFSAPGAVLLNSANGAFGILAQTVGGGDVFIGAVHSDAPVATVVINALASGNATVGANNIGVAGEATTGNVTVVMGNNNAVLVQGDNSIGVSGTSASGNVTIVEGTGGILVAPNSTAANENGNATVFPASMGIEAITGTAGSINVASFGPIIVANNPAGAAYGILAATGGNGTIAITTTADITTDNSTGADIYAQGATGTVVIANTAPDLISLADGIFAQSGGSVGIDSIGGNITAGGNAIYANSTGGGLVKVGNNQSITGNISGGSGIFATSAGGPVTVDNAAQISATSGSAITAMGGGAVVVKNAATLNGYAGGIAASGNSSIAVFENLTAVLSGNVTSFTPPGINVSGTAQGTTGISAVSTGGDVLVSGAGRDQTFFTGDDGLAGAVVTAGGSGILASTAGNGTVTVLLAGSNAGNATFLASPGGSVAISGADGVFGISAATTGSGNATVFLSANANANATASANISALATGANNIGLYAQTGTGTANLTANANDSITVAGDNSIGLEGKAAAGNVTISLGSAGVSVTSNTSGANENPGALPGSIGVAAIVTGATGAISITNAGVIEVTNNAAGAAYGVYSTNTGNGSISITTSGNIATHNALGADIYAVGGTGVVVVTNTAPSLTSSAYGIYAQSGGSVGVDSTGANITTGGGGIYAQSTGNGTNVRVGNNQDISGNITSGGNGIEAVTATGVAIVHNQAVVNATTGGIRAASTVAGDVFVMENLTPVVAGNVTSYIVPGFTVSAGPGIVATAAAGNVLVSGLGQDGTSGTADDGIATSITTTGGSGIVASTGTGDVTVLLASANAARVVGNGTMTLSPTPAGTISVSGAFSGIKAQITGASGNLTVFNGGTITVTNNGAGAAYGIYASNAGNGTATIYANANITANSAVGAAVYAAGGTGNTTINNNVTLSSMGTSTSPSVLMSSAGSGNVAAGAVILNNTATGVIQSIGNLTSDLVIAANVAGSGPVTINNAGRINGRVDLSGASASTFNNTSALSWHTSGASSFSNGNNTITNAHLALLATQGTTSFAFGNGNDTITNAGTFIAGENGQNNAASTLTITKGSGNLTFANSGTIILGTMNGNTTASDAQPNDHILASNMAFVSSSTSRILLDANLGAGIQNACSASAAVADCITIGASSGTGTRLTIHDTGGAQGAINLDGVVVVHAASGSASDFILSTLDPNVTNTTQGPAIVKGFVQYALVFDPTNVNWDLVGEPTQEVFEFSKVASNLQTLWYETAGSWNERNGLVRSQMTGGMTRSGWSLWGKAYGGWINRDRDNSLSVVNTTVSFDTAYWQDYYGIQMGGDYMIRNGAGGAILAGVLAGYNRSDTDFNGSVDRLHYTVYNAGAYASYMSGPVFADLLVKDDFARINPDMPSAPGIDHPNANSVGGELTLGARFNGPGVLKIEPMGTASYVSTTVDAISWQGMDFNWENGTSLRGTLAVKLSANFGSGQSFVEPFLLGGVGQELKGDNQLKLTGGGNSFTIGDKPIQTFATASFGINLSGVAGLSGYVRGDGLFGSNYTSGALRAGVRQQF